ARRGPPRARLGPGGPRRGRGPRPRRRRRPRAPTGQECITRSRYRWSSSCSTPPLPRLAALNRRRRCPRSFRRTARRACGWARRRSLAACPSGATSWAARPGARRRSGSSERRRCARNRSWACAQ
ncbi:unnamed protein product, partial [Prorocentrum cordatum]